MPQVRRIRPGERDAALATVVAAFRHDPQVRWWFPDDECYAEYAGRFFGVLLDTRIEGGEVWVDHDCRAVAMWIPPGGNLIGPEVASARYSAMLSDLPVECVRRVAATDEAADRLLPSTAHWYLGVLACHPDHRGLGLGAATAAPVLAAADRAGLPVALETALPANVGYYTRRGFAVVGSAAVGEALVGSGCRVSVLTTARASGPARASGSAAAPAPARSGVATANGESREVTIYVMQRQPR